MSAWLQTGGTLTAAVGAGHRLTENESGQLGGRGEAPAEGRCLMTLCCLPWKADLTARGPGRGGGASDTRVCEEEPEDCEASALRATAPHSLLRVN